MAISITVVRCPACGASFSIEEGRNRAFCIHCGVELLISNDNEYIYRQIDEARIKEAEAEQTIRLRELEIEQQNSAKTGIFNFVFYGIAIVGAIILGVLGVVIVLNGNEIGFTMAMVGLLLAVALAMALPEELDKRPKVVKTGNVRLTEAVCDYEGKNYMHVAQLFQDMGFDNVRTMPLNDILIFNRRKLDKVESVTIDGSSKFEEDDVFSRNAAVLITYHSKVEIL